jgi:uncharacterized membrane protein YbhN (UPF0104 family)
VDDGARQPVNRSRLVNLLGIAIGIAGLTFVAVKIVQDREEIADALASSNPVWLIVAVVFGLAAMALLGVNWLLIVRHGGAPAPWRRGLYWFFVGQLGKYVPGGIWPIVGQAELAHRDRTPRPVAYWSTAMSMVGTLLGALGVAAIAGMVSPAGSRIVPILFCIGLIVVFAALASPRIRGALHRLGDRITPRELRLPDAGWFAGIVSRYLPVWVLFSGMNIFSVRALGVTLDADLVVTLIYATCVSWIAGFVIIGLPGGLGVREAVFISMMTAPLGAGLAVSVAVISRVVSVAVDLLGAAVSIPVSRTAPPMAIEHGEAENPTSYAAP